VSRERTLVACGADRDPVLENYNEDSWISALGCYAIHAGFHILSGRPEEVLWMCHLGAALVGVGLLSSSATTNGIGTLFPVCRDAAVVMYLAGGREFYPTSCFPHLGGLAIGLYWCPPVGLPSGTWWRAVLALIALILVCRLVTPARAMSTLRLRSTLGGRRFSFHPIYLAAMMGLAAGYFVGFEYVLRRWLTRKKALERRHERLDSFERAAERS